MDTVNVIAVVGACARQRARYAKQLAETTGHVLIASFLRPDATEVAQEVAARARWPCAGRGAVVDVPEQVSVTELIGVLTADPALPTVRLDAVICVVDAAHLLTDLGSDDYVAQPNESGQTLTARALLTAAHLEFASHLVIVNWEPIATAELATLLALASHLSPRAVLRLHHGAPQAPVPTAAYTADQDRPGWVCLLNGEFEPHMTDLRVSAFRYENFRPFHPERLQRLLDERVELGEFGTLVRSAGFCRLATRPDIVAQWEQTGHMLSFTPLGRDGHASEDAELLALGQDIAFIGLDLDHDSLTAALDDATLTDEELAAGPPAWARFPDPFPAWHLAQNPTDQ
ncbi:GTP-binding protein [Saccharopolyspora rosea]|uniref:GTP-binding protein n=1 Tax=Saccharopolyspora rosea TaxID=524884 RepID=A0ABW3FR35_9PSEU|nr:GTP-binding protein [Saccharopolyspora rosea]